MANIVGGSVKWLSGLVGQILWKQVVPEHIPSGAAIIKIWGGASWDDAILEIRSSGVWEEAVVEIL